MKLTDLTIMEISGLRAVFPRIIKGSAPLVQITLRKVLQCIEDAEDELVAQSKSDDDSTEVKEAESEDIHASLYKKFMDFMTDANWLRYEADLAKELSVAYTKKGFDPIEAVDKAKEIVKRLKQNK